MTQMPLPCNPFRMPTTDDLRPFIIGALHAAQRQKRHLTRFNLEVREGAWTLISGGTTEVTAPHYICLSADAVKFHPQRIAEVARDLIDNTRGGA